MGAQYVCYYTTAHSNVNKLEEFGVLVENLQPDIIGITEIRGNVSISDALLTPRNYNLFRRGRVNGHGGGVLLLKFILKFINY